MGNHDGLSSIISPFPTRLKPQKPIVVRNILLYIDFDGISIGVTQLDITRKRGRSNCSFNVEEELTCKYRRKWQILLSSATTQTKSSKFPS